MKRYIISQLATILAIPALLGSISKGVEVEAEGRAAGDAPSARTQALTDALREAVRTGAGVDLVSESAMENYELTMDRTFTKARGYVKKYEVLSSGLRDDGFYTVTIKADVGEGPIAANDTMTFQMMAKEHESPRVAIMIEEEIEGVKNGTLGGDWLRNHLSQCGLQVVDLENAQGQGGMLSKRAQTLGRKTEGELRSQGLVSSCDYIIEGKIIGSAEGTQSYYGSKPGKKYSLGFDVKVRDAATGSIVLTENFQSRDIVIRNVSSDTAAAREAVRQFMEGNKHKENTDAGWMLIRRIFSHWAAEMDLGATIKLEFVGLDLASADKLKAELEKQTAIGSVWVRSIDAAGVSVVECESRLNSADLAKVINAVLPGYGLDRSEKRYLSFRPGAAPAEATPAAAPEAVATETEESSPWLMIGGIIAAVGVALGLLCIKLIKKNK